MKTSWNRLLGVFLAASTVASLCIGADLSSMRTTYEDKRFEIDATHNEAKKTLAKQYVATMDTAIESLLKQGDPVPVVKARKIRDEAAGSGSLPDGPQSDAPEVIRKVQVQFAAAIEKAREDKATKSYVLARHYLNALEREMKDLTTKGEIENALQFRKEAETMKRLLAEAEQTAGGEAPTPSDDADATFGVQVRTIPLTGGKTGGQWQRQLFTIPAGSFVRVSATAKESLSSEEPERRCFAVKLGKAGSEKWFNSGGRYNYRVKSTKGKKSMVWRSQEFVEFKAEQEETLYILQTQNLGFTLTVKMSPDPYTPASKWGRRKKK